MPMLDRDVEVFVLNIGDTENRFGPEWLAEVQVHLDAVASGDGPRAPVTTAAGKNFSGATSSTCITCSSGCSRCRPQRSRRCDDDRAALAGPTRWAPGSWTRSRTRTTC